MKHFVTRLGIGAALPVALFGFVFLLHFTLVFPREAHPVEQVHPAALHGPLGWSSSVTY